MRTEEARLAKEAELAARRLHALGKELKTDATFEEFRAKLKASNFDDKLPPELRAALGTGKSRPDLTRTNPAPKRRNPFDRLPGETYEDWFKRTLESLNLGTQDNKDK